MRTDCGAGAWSISVLGWISQINGWKSPRLLSEFGFGVHHERSEPNRTGGFWLGSVAELGRVKLVQGQGLVGVQSPSAATCRTDEANVRRTPGGGGPVRTA